MFPSFQLGKAQPSLCRQQDSWGRGRIQLPPRNPTRPTRLLRFGSKLWLVTPIPKVFLGKKTAKLESSACQHLAPAALTKQVCWAERLRADVLVAGGQRWPWHRTRWPRGRPHPARQGWGEWGPWPGGKPTARHCKLQNVRNSPKMVPGIGAATGCWVVATEVSREPIGGTVATAKGLDNPAVTSWKTKTNKKKQPTALLHVKIPQSVFVLLCWSQEP